MYNDDDNIFQNYQRHLTSKSYDQEDFGRLGGDDDSLPLEQVRDVPEVEPQVEDIAVAKKLGRKRKVPIEEEVRGIRLILAYLNLEKNL